MQRRMIVLSKVCAVHFDVDADCRHISMTQSSACARLAFSKYSSDSAALLAASKHSKFCC